MKLTRGQIVLTRYRIEEMLGAGAMGEVYRATHSMLGTEVAIKILIDAEREQLAERFEREARMMARVRHPNIVQILDYGMVEDDIPCIAMEYVEGESLGEYLVRHGKISWQRAVALGAQITRGLGTIHEAGIIHRDIKPDNIIYTKSKPRQAKLLDFGIARTLHPEDQKLTATGILIGTPAFMAPEMLLGDPATVKSDLYSVGLVLHELILGDLPFGAASMKGVMRRLKNPPPIPRDELAGVPEELITLIFHKLLAMDPDERLATTEELDEALGKILVMAAAAPSPSKAGVVLKRARKRKAKPPHAIELAETTDSGAVIAPEGLNSGSDQDSIARDGLDPGQPPQNPTPAPPANPTREEPPPPVTEAPPTPRRLFVAKLPSSTLASGEERGWLNNTVAPYGRGFIYGGQFWIAVLLARDEELARQAVTQITTTLTDRYGILATMDARPVTSSFSLTPASLSGLSPLPDEVQAAIRAVLMA